MEFKLWLISETINLAGAIQLFQYKPGELVDVQDLKGRYRKLSMKHHPDRGGDEEIMKQVTAAKIFLDGLVGRKIPNINMEPVGRVDQFFNDERTKARAIKDIKDELHRALASLQTHPEDTVAIIHGLVDPHMGKLNQVQVNPLLKSSLQQWLQYQKQGFNDYLTIILQNALKLI